MKILLHICCSNCAVYPVRILRSDNHDITGFWFNPNIHPHEEYDLRLESLKRLAGEWKFDMCFTETYSPEEYLEMFGLPDTVLNAGASGLHSIAFPERCRSCYQLRLEKTAAHARKEGFDAFSTTLLISPYQDFQQLGTTGTELAEKYNVQFLLTDYRPRFGEAMALAKDLGLYRQKYCGCIFSREERKRGRSA